jgi:class 3 adenylate cyclase
MTRLPLLMPLHDAEGPRRRSLRVMITIDPLPIHAARWLSAHPLQADPRMQRAFDRFHDRVNHLAMRWGMYTGTLLWALGGALGCALRPWNAEELAQSLGMALPFYIAVGVALGEPKFRGHYQWLAALCNLSSGLLVFAVAPRLPEPALSALVGFVIITFHAVLGLRLRVRYALPVMLVYNGLYLLDLWSDPHVRTEPAIVSTFLIGTATIGAAIAAFILEANLWHLFRSRSVQRAKRMRPDHRASALPEDLARRWREHPGLITEPTGTMNVLVARVTFDHTNGWSLNEQVDVLHTLLARFDTLTHRGGLERVRMTGGEFVVAASATRIGSGSANDMAELALTMLHLAEETPLPAGITLTLRIGIDQERAMCAAMGKAMPAYDVIGPSVDGARLLCDGAPEGCILVSQRFQHVVSDRFETQECGTSQGEPAFLLWGVKADRKRRTTPVLNSVTRLAFLFGCMAPAYPCAAQWQRITALPASDTPALLVHNGVLYAGTDSTVWRSTDGVSWLRGATIPTPGYFVDALYHDGSTLFAGTGGNGLFVSPTDGITWQHFSQGLAGLGSQYIADVAVFADDLWCATVGAGVFRRSGATWEPFGDLDGMNAGNVAMLRVIGDTLWAGAGGNGYLWRTTPGASQFEPKLVAPLNWDPHAITDILSIGGELLACGTYGIYRSADGGASWTWSSTGLPGGGIVRFIPTANGLYALRSGASSRLYRSADNGTSWELVEQLPFCYAITAFNGRLYAGRTDGLWVRDLATGIDNEHPSPQDALSLYPNPADDIVQVRVAVQGQVIIELIDAQGRVIRDERSLEHRHVLDVSGCAPGAYVVRVVHARGSEERRLLVH